LRPAGAEALLAPLERDPRPAPPYASAAIFYANTHVAGMALIWGVTYGAIDPDGPQTAAVAAAMARVLRERVTFQGNGGQAHIATKLAPGEMIVLAQPGTPEGAPKVLVASVAHLFEGAFVLAIGMSMGTATDRAFTLSSISRTFATFVSVIEQRKTPFDPRLEIQGWLGEAARAGQLEPFIHRVFGPAFPAELTTYEAAHPGAMAAARAYVAARPFRPTRPSLPDTLEPAPPKLP
jgi:hypothetical protein